ncbi:MULTISPECIES: RidA family protein [Pseudomonas]|jgi:enamine deaminase RidA (YjgF/YER057c/UK114 family)|uniref:Cytochrome C2 n=3 Tax=Pseudomonas TaxID=286 RepID=V9USY6_9PSED|nr:MULTISPECIES: RidA family protein [Pseudomonas]MCO6691313.1 RidA family protein [Pseudomonas shirazica]AEJ11474.1 endoribonuclease L-PSP family protein [Pseudomonas putida S16]AHC80920.1 cytochrome C2 [Pseudomonas monteilii SB3078]AHC86349.1 cytochrome C2 [Pseudomonas monteilii SB3101]AHZ75381.1 endoribonuclease L-PSP [Pseudomonas putida]
MTINRIQPNPRLSGAVTFGDLVFLSGQVPDDATDAGGQTRQVLEKIDALLAEAGSDKDHLLSATIYLKDIGKDFAAMNEVWSAWLSPGQAPSRTTLQAELARPQVLVEITVIAARR